jgi:5-formyltetrahydrofolate cyclo-ligase
MSGSEQSLKDAKEKLRKEIIAIRNALGFSARLEKDTAILQTLQGLPEIKTAGHLFCFVSLGTETDTHNLIDWLQLQGKRVAIPKITAERTIIAVEFPGWPHLHAGQFGIPEPESSVDVSSKMDICVIPGVCFDRAGNRLGHGGGYYDKWLKSHAVKQVIAPAYDCQILDSIPACESDHKVDVIVSETGVIRP